METHIKLGHLFGIQIGLHYSWLLIALLIVLSLATHFQATNPDWGQGIAWALAVATSALFFASIVAHEMAHSLVAQAHGLKVRAITLFALGGVSQIEQDPKDPKTEFWMAVVGPLASAAVGGVFLTLALLLGWQVPESPETPALAMLVWLGYINILLAVFNMIPGFPMDGGRILRAIIWWKTGDSERSTRMAAMAGRFVALAFIVFGLIRFFGGAGLGGLWIAFVGWFLLNAASATYAQSEILSRLGGIRVGEVMRRDCLVVEANTNLQTFVDEYLLRSGERCFIVADQTGVQGLITPHEVKQVKREQWPYKTVGDVMKQPHQLRTVEPDTPLIEALKIMSAGDINQLPVVSDGRLEGVISRGHILQVFQTRAELQA